MIIEDAMIITKRNMRIIKPRRGDMIITKRNNRIIKPRRGDMIIEVI